MQNNHHHHYLRRLRRFVFYSIAGILVVLAVLMSTFRVVVNEADSWRMELQELGTRVLERQVYIEALDARLDGLSPILVLKNVRLMNRNADTEFFSFREGKLELDILDSIKTRSFIPTEFTVQGAEFTIVRHQDKSFSFKGLELKNPDTVKNDADSKEFIEWLFKRTDLNIQDSTIIWIDLFRKQQALRLQKVNMHLHNKGDRHQLKASVQLPETLGRSFEFSLDAHGDVATSPADWSGKIYIQGNGILPLRLGALPAVQNYKFVAGLADFELWGEWNNGQLEQLSGELTAYNLAVQNPDMQQNLKLKLLSGLFDYQGNESDWNLNIKHFQLIDDEGSWPQTDISIEQRKLASSNTHKSSHKQTQIKINQFRLENVSRLLLRSVLLSSQQTEMLEQIKPSGDIENFQIRFIDDMNNPEISLVTQFSQFGINPWEKWPGFHGLSGKINGDHRQMQLSLNSHYAVFDLPTLFREPLKISMLSGLFDLQHHDQGWQISSDSLILKNEDVELNSRVAMNIPDNKTSTFMDLKVEFKNGNAEHVSRYLPVTIMSSGLVDWLDRGIVSGRIIKGGAVFQGRLSDFPFHKNEGQFRVEFEAENAHIDYLQGWPMIDNGHLNAVFTDRGMDIKADSGTIFESHLSSTSIQIDEFLQANLRIKGEVNGELKDALRFLIESPIQPKAKPLIESMRSKGYSRLELDLSIPLDDEVEKTQPLSVNGTVHLSDAELLMLDDLLELSAINGSIVFTQDTRSAKGIRAKVMGGEATLDLHTGDKQAGQPMIIEAKGVIDSAHLAQTFGLPASAQVNGVTDWRGSLLIPSSYQDTTVLKIYSQLQGVEVNLPQPLGKARNESRDSMLEIRFDPDGETWLSAHSKNYLSGAVILDTNSTPIKPRKAYVHFGKGKGWMPETESLKFSGSLAMFSLAPWMDALEQGRDEVTEPFVSLPLIFDMSSLQLAPVTDGADAEENSNSEARVDASHFPLVQGVIKKLFYDDVLIGRLEIQTSRLKLRKGIQLDSFSLEGEDLNMQASGEWVQWPNRDISRMKVKLDSPDLGKMLSALGFSAIFQGGKTSIEGRLNWPNLPMGIHLSELESKLNYTVANGVIASVEPGAGRLLGLFSLAALPRRLMLDFSDAFGDGLHFDSIEGELNVHDGSVFMDKNLMKSPLAHISVSGRTGLVARDFDQMIRVMPRGGDALTAVAGGMLFGPQIGAVILLVQKIIGNELEDATAIKYKVTGSWEEPVITKLNKPKESEAPSFDDDF